MTWHFLPKENGFGFEDVYQGKTLDDCPWFCILRSNQFGRTDYDTTYLDDAGWIRIEPPTGASQNEIRRAALSNAISRLEERIEKLRRMKDELDK